MLIDPVRVEVDASVYSEEARHTQDHGKSLGLYADNDDDGGVINTLADLYMEKEGEMKQARARGKKGGN